MEDGNRMMFLGGDFSHGADAGCFFERRKEEKEFESQLLKDTIKILVEEQNAAI